MDKNILRQLQDISKKRDWDVIEEVGYINGKPVYQLRCSAIPLGHKVGYPHLFSFDNFNIVYALNFEQVRIIIKQDLFQQGGKRIQ